MVISESLLGNGLIRRWGGGVWESFRFDMDITLGERNRDVIITEGLPDSKEDFRANVTDSARCVIDTESNLQKDGGISKILEQTHWSGVLECTRDSGRGLGAKPNCFFDIGVIGNSNLSFDPDNAIRVGAIDHLVGDKVFVGNQELFAVTCDDGDVAGMNRIDPAEGSVDFDDIARFD